MQTEVTTTTEQALKQRVTRLSASLERLNARIARLAETLDIALDQHSQLEHALQREASTHGDVRERRMREELRGLLVLRYSMTCTYTREFGATLTRELMVCAEEKLQREGFRAGADGIDLRALSAVA